MKISGNNFRPSYSSFGSSGVGGSKLSAADIKSMVASFKLGTAITRDFVRPGICSPQIKVRQMTIFLDSPRSQYEFIVRLDPDEKGEAVLIKITTYKDGNEIDNERGPVYGYFIREFGPNMTVEKLFKLPMEDVFFKACGLEPRFADMFSSFLELPTGDLTSDNIQ